MSVLNKILNLVDAAVLAHAIDRPLDAAFGSFVFEQSEQPSHDDFNETLQRFYQHLNQHGLRRPRTLSHATALRDVLWLLDGHYRGHETTGYDAAHLDASSYGKDGIIIVLEQLVQIIKAIERTHYISWIINTTIDPSDWQRKNQVVEEILRRFGHLFSPDLGKLSAAQLVPHLEELIAIITVPAFP